MIEASEMSILVAHNQVCESKSAKFEKPKYFTLKADDCAGAWEIYLYLLKSYRL